MPEDAELLRAYAETRSEKAFAELVRRRVGLVYSVALRKTGDAHRAQDVAQRVFTDLARKASALAARPVLLGWLYRSAHYAASDILRSERSRAAREQEAHAMQQLTAGEEPAPDWDQVRPLLDDALNEMEERDRDAILLRFIDGRPFAEVGARLALSENAARMRVDRALDKLRLRLGRRGVTSSTAALAAALGHPAMAAAPAGLAGAVTGAALSGAAAGGAGAAFAAFMSSTKIMTGVAVAALLAVSVAVHEVREERALRVGAAATRRAEQALAADVARARQQADIPARALGTVLPPLASSAARPTPPRSAVELGAALMATDPELRIMSTQILAAKVRREFFPLYRELNLTEAQIVRFETIMSAGAGRNMSWGVTGYPDVELDPVPPLPAAEKEARLRALLGEAGRQRLAEYERTRNDAVPRIATELALTATPLRPEQVRQLNELVTAQRAKRIPGKTMQVETWAGILAEAGRFLDAPQMAALEHQRARDIFAVARVAPSGAAAK